MTIIIIIIMLECAIFLSMQLLIEDIAVDWISKKLYWTETLYRRIEVLDLETLINVPILSVEANSGIRGIALDPSTRCIIYTL